MERIKNLPVRLSVLVFLAAVATACPAKKEPQDNTALFLLLAAANACSTPSAAPSGCSAACSKDTTAALGTVVGSCSNVMALPGTCIDFGTGWETGTAQGYCTGVSGTWATTSCPTTNVATAVRTETATGKVFAGRYYSPTWITTSVAALNLTSTTYSCSYSEP